MPSANIPTRVPEIVDITNDSDEENEDYSEIIVHEEIKVQLQNAIQTVNKWKKRVKESKEHRANKLRIYNKYSRLGYLSGFERIVIQNIEQEISDKKRKLNEAREVLQGVKRKLEKNDDDDDDDLTPECPICTEMMTPPKKIYQCPEGHLVCSECKPRLSNNCCATCRSEEGYVSRCRWIEEMIVKKRRIEN